MFPERFDYIRAGSVAEAIEMLGQHADARLLAGGHSLIPAMKLRLDRPAVLIDIGRIAELRGISALGGSVRIGALTTHAEIASSDVVPKGLSEAAGWVGDPQVRNRGTIGGNVVHADPASDLPTILSALDAGFELAGPGGSRTVAASDFFQGYFQTDKQEGEILTAIVVPTAGASAYEKLSNQASGYCMVGVGVSLQASGGSCTAAGVAVGGLTPGATRCPSVEAALVGSTLDDAAADAAAAAVLSDLGDDLLGDIHASVEYRKAMAGVFVKRAVLKAASRLA